MNNEIEEIYDDFERRYEKTLTPKQLANILKAWVNSKITAQAVNIKLEELEFQHKDGDIWVINNDVDNTFFELQDYRSKYSNHIGTRILWKSKIIHILIEEFRKEYEEEKENGKK